MPKYQLIFNHGGSSKSFRYFETTDNPAIVGAEVLSGMVEQKLIRAGQFQSGRLPRTVRGVEYDTVTKKPKRGGVKFKLWLRYVKATYGNGITTRTEWYEAETD